MRCSTPPWRRTISPSFRPGQQAQTAATRSPSFRPTLGRCSSPSTIPKIRSNWPTWQPPKTRAPIMLNRLLCDADLVLPINLLRPESALLYSGPHGGLCPTFSDAETQQRFRTPNTMASRTQQRQRREEADEVAWLLGIQLTLQIIAGPGDTRVAHPGRPGRGRVAARAANWSQAAWGYDVAKRAELVVATIEGEQRTPDLGELWPRTARRSASLRRQRDHRPLHRAVLQTGPALKRLAELRGQRKTAQAHRQRSLRRCALRLAAARSARHGTRLSAEPPGVKPLSNRSGSATSIRRNTSNASVASTTPASCWPTRIARAPQAVDA